MRLVFILVGAALIEAFLRSEEGCQAVGGLGMLYQPVHDYNVVDIGGIGLALTTDVLVTELKEKKGEEPTPVAGAVV